MNLKFLIISLFTIISTTTIAQSSFEKKNAIALQYGISSTILSTEYDGSPSFEGYAHNIGLTYNKDISYSMELATGLIFSKNSLTAKGINGNGERFEKDYEATYLHVPMLVQYNFLKVLFTQLGPSATIQLDNNSAINKSGIGLWASIGAQFTKNNLLFKINPYYHSQDVISFKKNIYQSQQNVGANISVGLKF